MVDEPKPRSAAGPKPKSAKGPKPEPKSAGPAPESRPKAAESASPPAAEPSGPELARAVLDAARARRETNRPQRRTRSGADGAGGEGADGQPRRRLRGYSGPGPDPRDPQLLGTVLARLVKARGWQQPTAEATVFGAWERVVGPDVAKHSRPVKLEDGELTVEAESTAWATQLRLLAGSLLQRIAGEVGHNVVRKLNIHGPTAPSWSRGPRRVRGRGPRDTYG
ncbi:putative nucleic acid-binding Zn ribbon protein [Micromonospora pisi]|uniref:Putative nucleic acid-binding Zn ribbon protein n=1 Tax=Micromonospora pisi TaxID=589240 RepID=A0A495JMK7_9ACTN|nr:putative nucleic acid-binding Zn ribbon protein [Micromonospora pisi]